MINKIIKIFFVLVCMISIFKLSSDNDKESSKKSDGLIINVTKIIIGHNLNKKEEKKYVTKYVHIVRKLAHYTIYLLLGLSLISLVKEYRQLDIKAILIALIISMLYACSDEIHQLFIPGRSGEIKDVLIDSIGALSGIYIYYYLNKIRRRKYEQKKAIS